MKDSSTIYDVFLSYNNLDHTIVETVARELQQRGLSVFLDRWYLVPGTLWTEHVEEVLNSCRSVAIFLGPSGMGRWQHREKYVALDRQAKTPAFPVIPVLLPSADPALGFLSLNTWIDMRQGLREESLLLLDSAIKGEPPEAGVPREEVWANISPYRGLEFFREEDSDFFFGRNAFVDKLVTAVNQHQLVAVVGESGSGKSSVVRAGLMPRLRRNDGKRIWEIATMVPGDRPLRSLAAVMVSILETDMSENDRLAEIGKTAESYRVGEVKLRDAVERALAKQPGTNSFMLVVDQWEELYTLTSDDELRRRFIDELLDATSSGKLSVVFTLRADFYGDVLKYRPLSDRVQSAIVNISSLSGPELRQAIEEPAQKVGLQFESGLVDRVLDKVERQSGSLPLLEFVLKELWKKRSRGVLTHAAYESVGKLAGAIATYAETVYEELTPSEQDIARRVFLRLVRPSTESASTDDTVKLTRRRLSFSELGPESLVVVRKLADKHLIVTGRNEATGEEIVDLVHEALISEWSTLNSWINEDLMFLTWRERLRTLMVLSPRTGHQASLLRGNLLAEAAQWLSRREADLSDSEKLFIRSSSKSRETRIVQNIITAMVIVGVFAVPLIYFISSNFGSTVNGSRNANSSPPQNVSAEVVSSPTGVGPSPTSSVEFPDVKVPEGAVVIPVVVHVVYRRPEENISDKQIQRQISALNRDFRATNEDISQVPAAFKDAVGDAHIEFALATKDLHGKRTSGITRTKTSTPFFSPTRADVHFTAQGGADGWPPEKYLNIWVCHIEGEWPGIVWEPGSPRKWDGVIIHYEVFGSVTAASRRHVTHNVGIFFNLRHLWGDKKDCTGTDEVDDTPPQQGPNSGSPSFPHVTCNNGPNGDMFMNFMDHTSNTCMFTKGQVLRMHQTLQGQRRGLGTLKQ